MKNAAQTIKTIRFREIKNKNVWGNDLKKYSIVSVV